jgi:NADH-quinone oxidoreductase subunit L
VGVYSVAMFHLLTHAFFKAMLFLGAGSVIHAMHHEQDMRNYGNLRKKIPLTFAAMMTGTLAITGVGIPLTHIGFAGFLSKDAIIESAWGAHTDAGNFAFVLLVVAAMMTSFYSWRLMFMTFYGTERGDKHTHEHAHESPWTMTVPLGVLAIGAIFSGMVFFKGFFGDHHDVEAFFGISEHEVHATAAPLGAAMAASSTDSGADDHGDDHGDKPAAKPGQGAIYMHPDNHTLDNAHHAPTWVKVAPFFAMLFGFVLSYMMYIRKPHWPAALAKSQAPLYNFLLNKWYFDELYDILFVRSAKWLGRFLWKKGDGKVIDGGINGLAMGIIPFLTRKANKAQSGYLFHYAFGMFIGLALLITWFTIRGAG